MSRHLSTGDGMSTSGSRSNAAEQAAAPLACVMGAIPAEARAAHGALIARLFREAAEEREELPDGLAFRFPVAEFDAVARFVGNERLCCPFLDFRIEFAAAGTLRLELTGPPGTPQFLINEFGL